MGLYLMAMSQILCIFLFMGTITQGLPVQNEGVRCGTGESSVNCVEEGPSNDISSENVNNIFSSRMRRSVSISEMDTYSVEESGSGTDTSSGVESSSEEKSGSGYDRSGEDNGSGYDSSMPEEYVTENEFVSEDSVYKIRDQDENFNAEVEEEDFIL
ncbi:Hypothetical predicted protein [Pelobates cultripes]|uniref:Uncharacterized protein n=1 Tax=Pelobates cultripes TaxID=61616 RepID=A0AAD1TET0_PELCU|nr:Hypothetical predicted protein [Pelobates cultripes]